MKKIFIFFILLFSIISSYEQTLTAVSPTSAVRGQLLNVSISGSNTFFSQATNTTVWFEQGSSTIMLPNNIVTVNDNTLTTTLQVNPLQPTGLYNVRLNNSVVGNLSLLNSFTVNINTAQLISVTPNSASQGSVLNVTISGQNTHFNQGTGTVCWFQQGSSTIIYPTTQNSTSATNLTANYSIPSNAVPGYYHTYTNNSTDGILMLASSFLVNIPSSFYILATANPANGGYVTGSGSYNINQNCILSAHSFSGYHFVNWTENAIPVSTDSIYSFTVNSNRTLVANFTIGISVPEINNVNSILIYPNPASKYFNIDFNFGFEKDMQIQIYDVLGNRIIDQSITNRNPVSINVENLKNGIYYIKIKQQNNSILIKKLLINK
ncbi:MAG: T9SS type A sorting domain-containing protein [Bacteroidetes bacterium]|nr:T9SS type A sorting domain-containing protein [Bacteroidota bacterium]